MNELINIRPPNSYAKLYRETERVQFSMASDQLVGSLIRSLVGSKPGGRFLDLGTGSGLSLSWMLDGMDKDASAISLDNDQNLIHIARSFFGDDPRLELLCTDGKAWIEAYQGAPFDLIFADAWPPLLVLVMLSLVLAWFASRWHRQYARPHNGAWVALIFLLGVPGFIAYWAYHRRAPLENCPECGVSVPRDQDSCASCARPFAEPIRLGTEIFA